MLLKDKTHGSKNDRQSKHISDLMIKVVPKKYKAIEANVIAHAETAIVIVVFLLENRI